MTILWANNNFTPEIKLICYIYQLWRNLFEWSFTEKTFSKCKMYYFFLFRLWFNERDENGGIHLFHLNFIERKYQTKQQRKIEFYMDLDGMFRKLTTYFVANIIRVWFHCVDERWILECSNTINYGNKINFCELLRVKLHHLPASGWVEKKNVEILCK